MRSLVFTTIILQLCLITSFASESPLKIVGPLHTHGASIIDSQGREVYFRGVNVSGMEWGTGTRWGKHGCHDPKWGKTYGCYALPKQSTYDDIAEWGFNIVRLPISWANLEPEPNGNYNQEYLAAVDNIIAEFAKRGIPVILSMHQWDWSPRFKATKRNGNTIHGNGEPVWLYPDEWFNNNPIAHREVSHTRDGQEAASREFFMNHPKRVLNNEPIQEHLIKAWKYVAQHYASSPSVVGADLFNEPYGNDGNSLEAFYLRAGQAIHEANPNLLLIFEQSLSHQKIDPKHLLIDSSFQGKGIYSVHIYKETADKFLAKLQQALAHSQEWNVPLWIGEFHCIIHKRSDNPFGFVVDQQGTQQIMDFMKKSRIHWTYWAYQKDAQPLDGKNDHPPENLDLVHALQHGF